MNFVVKEICSRVDNYNDDSIDLSGQANHNDICLSYKKIKIRLSKEVEMNIRQDHIKKLIFDAHKLLEQKKVDELSRKALMNCLRSVRRSQPLATDVAKEIDRLISS